MVLVFGRSREALLIMLNLPLALIGVPACSSLAAC